MKSWKKRTRTYKPTRSIFLGGTKFTNNLSRVLQCRIRRVSISATVSLEPAALAENEGSQKEVEILQAQLERIEFQLEKAREAAVLDRQACRTAQTDLYKVCMRKIIFCNCFNQINGMTIVIALIY